MNLTGIHFLLTYQCNFECDHCFVWGGPSTKGTFKLKQIRKIYREACIFPISPEEVEEILSMYPKGMYMMFVNVGNGHARGVVHHHRAG